MNSLGDQLLKKGLVSKTELQQANNEKRVSTKKKPKAKKQKVTIPNPLLKKAKSSQNSDKQDKIKENLANRAKNAQIKDLLNTHQVNINREKADEKYYFTLNKQVDFIYIDSALKVKLSKKIVSVILYIYLQSFSY